jgi:hypothetical protein
MVPGHSKYFRIDPEDTIIPTLRGCGNRAQLIAVWEILHKRLELGQEFFKKYLKEIRSPDSIEAFSPASTTNELTNELESMSPSGARQRFMLAYYLHHNEKLLLHSDRLEVTTANWEEVLRLTRGKGNWEESAGSHNVHYQSQPDDTTQLFETEDDTVREGKQRELEDEVQDEFLVIATGRPRVSRRRPAPAPAVKPDPWCGCGLPVNLPVGVQIPATRQTRPVSHG